MFEDWSAACRSIVERLRPALCQHGAEFYPVNLPGQVRVGWPERSGNRNVLFALLKCKGDVLRLKLRVGRNSGLIGEGRPLYPSDGAERTDSERDYGNILLSTPDIPARVFEWIDLAAEFTCTKYAGKLGDGRPMSRPAPRPQRLERPHPVAVASAMHEVVPLPATRQAAPAAEGAEAREERYGFPPRIEVTLVKPEDKSGWLGRLKLVLEIAGVALAVIAATIALVWRSR